MIILESFGIHAVFSFRVLRYWEAPQYQIVCFFLTASAPPPPLVMNIYVADFSKGLLKKCTNACCGKCVKIVRKS